MCEYKLWVKTNLFRLYTHFNNKLPNSTFKVLKENSENKMQKHRFYSTLLYLLNTKAMKM